MNIEHSFDYLLGFHCTPTLAGIKPANLISLKEPKYLFIENELKKFNLHFNKRNIYAKTICKCNSNILILIYNSNLLKRNIDDFRTRTFLKDLGYPIDLSLDENLKHLAERLKENSDFPHEIGIFLGYPYDDVIGFKDNNGKNYLFSGYWKVYTNEENTKALFEQFTKCRNSVCNKIENGMCITQIFGVA